MIATSPRPAKPSGRLDRWMLARVAVATLLLGGTVLLTSGTSTQGSFTHRVLLGLIIVTYTSSALIGVASLRKEVGPRAREAIVALDVLTISLLLWVTGGALSVFTVLLAVNVVVAALVVDARAAWVASFASLMVYLTITIGSASGWLPLPPDQTDEPLPITASELGVAILSNTAGLLLIPGLASMLASRLRHAGGELRRAAENAAQLARLNDDIVRCIASGLIAIDLDGRIQSVNPAGAEMLGALPDAIVGEPIERFFPEIVVRAGGARGKRDELMGARGNGERFPVGYSASALVDDARKQSGTLLSFQDLTEVRRLREIASREERLAALGRLSAGLAHEIRNPLSSISGSVELVRESGTLDAEDAHLLRIVSVEAERLNELVTTMLGFARTRELRPAVTDIGALLSDVATVARSSPTARDGIAIDVEVGNGLIARVDADQIRQVVWNLLKNALQASPPGSHVSLSAHTRTPGSCVIEVRDEGPGLGDESEERLFDAFFTTRTHGIGLGLALVRQIVDRHGGAVEATNHPAGGAVFRVTLPLGLQ